LVFNKFNKWQSNQDFLNDFEFHFYYQPNIHLFFFTLRNNSTNPETIKCMEIKGTAVKTTPDFIKEKFPNRYMEWLQSMPESSRRIFEQPLYATSWYNLIDSVIIPTQKVGDLFFNGNHTEAAHTLGRYSAEIALKGIYKIFIRVSSPHFVLSRASSIFSAYYNPSEIKVVESKDKRCVLHLSKFHVNEKLIMHRIAGWVEQTLEITLKRALSVDVHNEVKGTDLITLITIEWD
jgi:hypothetical protein